MENGAGHVLFEFEGDGDHRDLHVLTHSFPTRRSSDLSMTGFASPGKCGWMVAAPSVKVLASLSIQKRASPGWSRTRASGRAYQVCHRRSEEHTYEFQSLMRISYAVFCLKKNNLYPNILHH